MFFIIGSATILINTLLFNTHIWKDAFAKIEKNSIRA